MTEQETLVDAVHEDGTALLTLNRPAKKNALSDALLVELNGALAAALEDDAVRTICLRGAGNCFSAGRDIGEFGKQAQLQDQSLEHGQAGFLSILRTLMESPKPTIASVRGIALGGGQAMTLACDFVVAERDAQFGNVEMAYGFPAAMNTVLLTRHLGRRLGLEIAMTGDLYSAERYFEFGLINRLAEPGELESTTRAFLDLLNSRAPWAVARTKATYRVAEENNAINGLYVGNELNQLLMLASQTQSVHSSNESVRRALGKNAKNESK